MLQCKLFVVQGSFEIHFNVISHNYLYTLQAIHRGKTCSTYQAEQGSKGDKDLSLKEKLMALDAQQKIRCPECMSDNLNPPNNNFIRCRDCRTVFSPPKPESKK